jgi:hypothetical protein
MGDGVNVEILRPFLSDGLGMAKFRRLQPIWAVDQRARDCAQEAKDCQAEE